MNQEFSTNPMMANALIDCHLHHPSGRNQVPVGVWTMTALASEEPAVPDKNAPETANHESATLLTKLAAALGLPPDSKAEAILSAILAALLPDQKLSAATASERPDPARFVPINAVIDLLADRNGRIATMRESEAAARVDAALRGGHITPAMRDWATDLCMQDVTSFDTFLSKSPALFAHLHRELLPGAHPGRCAETALASEDETMICAQLGLKPDALRD